MGSFKKNEWSGKRYNLFGSYLKTKYGYTVLKLPINAGLGCPNRDGTLSTTGCIFCSDDGSASGTASENNSVTEQMRTARDSFSRNPEGTRYIAYFQAYSNTYAPVEKLRKIYDEALSFPGIIGLMIGTRPDCINEEIMKLISHYSLLEKWIELGMQTIHDSSLVFLNRQHSYDDVIKAIALIRKFNIKVCLHVILGIPGEKYEDMMKTAESINKLDIQGVKLHHLHVIKNTELEKIYCKNPFYLPDMNEYTSIVADFIERLNPEITIHRISGDRESSSLIAPHWGLHKGSVQKALDEEFEKRKTWQGFLSE